MGKMIDNFTAEELSALANELREAGMFQSYVTKQFVIEQEAKKLGILATKNLTKNIESIADEALDNFEYSKNCKAKITRRRKNYVPLEISENYKTIVLGILKVIEPYISKQNDAE